MTNVWYYQLVVAVHMKYQLVCAVHMKYQLVCAVHMRYQGGVHVLGGAQSGGDQCGGSGHVLWLWYG
jgi:hypothetical protein